MEVHEVLDHSLDSDDCVSTVHLRGKRMSNRLDLGTSDPVSYTCECGADTENTGLVLLFYRYYQNKPQLPGPIPTCDQIKELAQWQEQLTSQLEITGKIRIANEGFNITVGGRRHAIDEYVKACCEHWSFKGLHLHTEDDRNSFFKPSPGCACVFLPSTKANVKICSEITPLGITNYAPLNWDIVEELPPAEFHRRCHEERVSLMDLRNYYESRIGYFITPETNEIAERPQIRRFSQWPRFIKSHVSKADEPDQLLTYCTGGIRCEKATRWMAERPQERRRICTLKGGISAYLDWIKKEGSSGRMKPSDSLFKGKNYVFDARGSMGLDGVQQVVAQCHVCGVPEDRLSKCSSLGCHLVLVVCLSCESKSPRCCESCQDINLTSHEKFSKASKAICDCEKSREEALWRFEAKQPAKTQGWRKRTMKEGEIDIKLNIIS